MLKKYETPKLSRLGDIRELTQSGSPNQSLDAGSIYDFIGPDSRDS
ncbi:MAG: lasso RiPP family leader peptide-containing protein [Dehalococcoidia bacterium]|nr:lasso RiPP family leader peptide-containing protein [Dehalococcoidia bacterium]